MQMRSALVTRWNGAGVGVVDAVALHEVPEVLEAEPRDLQILVDGFLPDGFQEVTLAGAAGPAQNEVLPARHPLQGPERLLGGLRDAAGGLVPGVEGLVVGEAGLRPASLAAAVVAPLGFLLQQDSQGFGGIPALAAGGGEHLGGGGAQVRQAQPARELLDLALHGLVTAAGAAHRPKPSQARVPACRLGASNAAVGEPGPAARRWFSRLMRSSCSKRCRAAAAASAASTSPAPR